MSYDRISSECIFEGFPEKYAAKKKNNNNNNNQVKKRIINAK